MNKIFRYFVAFLIIYTINLNAAKIGGVYEDKIIGFANETAITKIELLRHKTLFHYLMRPELGLEISSATLNDLIVQKIQVKIAKAENLEVSDEQIKDVYVQCAQRRDLKLFEFAKLARLNHITKYDIKGYLKEEVLIEKLHEHLFLKTLSASPDEIGDYYMYSNNYDTKHSKCHYRVLEISIKRNKDNKKNLDFIKQIVHAINSHKTIQKFSKLRKNNEAQLKTFSYVIKRHIYSEAVRNVIAKRLGYNIVGPIYTGNHIILLKVFKKRPNINTKNLDIKIGHFFIKKKSTRRTVNNFKNSIDAFKQLNEIKRILNNNYEHRDMRIELLSEMNLPRYYKKRILLMNVNDISDIIETKTGWHLFKIIGKDYDRNSKIYKLLSSSVRSYKFKKARRNYIKYVRREYFIKLIYDNFTL